MKRVNMYLDEKTRETLKQIAKEELGSSSSSAAVRWLCKYWGKFIKTEKGLRLR